MVRKPSKKGVAANPERATPVPVLVPLEKKEEEPDGCVLLQKGKETEQRWVKHFVLEPKTVEVSKRFAPIARMLDLVELGRPIDYRLLKEGFRTLVEDAFGLDRPAGYGRRLTDALSEQAVADQVVFARRWLPAVFNREIPPALDFRKTKGARIVMWWPEHTRRFFPAIYCADRETALYVSLLFRRVRLCPGCGVPFEPGSHTDQRFHSINCATNYRMRRYRRKQQEQRSKSKKGKRRAKN